MGEEMTHEQFSQQIKNRLTLLQDNGLISAKTAVTLTKAISARQQLLTHRNIPSRPAALFDVVNLVNIVIFGMKGEKLKTIFEINPIHFKFLNGTISAQFTLAGKYSGSGSVFSLGLLGWKYSYGHNQTKYPTFPHFPTITGGVLAFTGILIDVESRQPGYPGHYVMGTGMSRLTTWNRAE